MRSPIATRRVRIAVVLFLVGAFAGLLVGLNSLGPKAGPEVHLAFSLAPGRYVEHDITLAEDAALSPFSTGATMKARTDVAVRLRLEGVRGEAPADGSLISARFVSVQRATTLVDGKDALGSAAALAGPVATVVIGADGQLKKLTVPDGDSPDFARVLQLVLLETAMPLGSGSRWTATEKLPRATFTSTVRTRLLEASGTQQVVSLVRSRVVSESSAPRVDLTHTPKVQGASFAQVRSDGVLLELNVTETVTAYDGADAIVEERVTKATSRLVNEGATDATAVADANGATLDPSAPVMTKDQQRTALERRTEGLTRDALNQIMQDAVKNGAAPDHNKFLWRATARLKLDDGAVDDIAVQFGREEASANGRGLVLDLLANASSAHAQETLIALLQDPPADNATELSRWRQRLALVPAPTPATIDFLITQSKNADESWRDPARIALGAASRHRRELGDLVEASRASAALAEQVGTTESDRATEVMVLALGNTYDPDLVDEIVAHASSQRAQLRHVVAEALREIDHPTARSTLLALSTDPAEAVSRRALESLHRQPIGASEVSALLSATSSGAIPELALGSLATTLTPHAKTPDGRAALEAILVRKPDPRLQARVRAILRDTQGP